ncbi:nicotinate-nucleotide adenylyltransferase [Streptomyces coelicoflavus]|uniref:Probable nicotinate-nucleotide adenylyltransferase n=1 Tax=Streptomyces coelicoflavus TaxID=285562 RepID=A0A7K3PMX1_9ACTN|nr:nicotinate-nucleotide adenylyltransferase [Streptomyces coelicoflavus]NEB10285.1 nicotinate-nucleotide adenylyltransferase [Streptomyces coelicoflavus]
MGEHDTPTGPAHAPARGTQNAVPARAPGPVNGPGGGPVNGPGDGPVNGPGDGPTSGKRRLGVMGGTFDPIHHGHLVAASEVAAQFQLDEVVFVPTGQPWQKSHRAVSAAEDRYLMTVVATVENPQFSVSRIDIDRGGPTYTVDTLRDLHALNPDADLFFITGADALAQILTWRDSEELFSLAHFIGVTRPGHTLTDAGLPKGGVSLVEVPALAISSTDCRARVAKGDPVWYLVPDGVVRYIDKRRLYRGE